MSVYTDIIRGSGMDETAFRPSPEPGGEIVMTMVSRRLRGWEREGVVQWLDERDDVAELWARSHIAVLPSYREGLPKSLLEAAACGRPMVATDVPGCREIVIDGETGLLVPARDCASLAEALARLAGDTALRKRMGASARRRVLDHFSQERVAAETLELYQSLAPTPCRALAR